MNHGARIRETLYGTAGGALMRFLHRRTAEEDEDENGAVEADELVSEFRQFIEGVRPEDFES